MAIPGKWHDLNTHNAYAMAAGVKFTIHSLVRVFPVGLIHMTYWLCPTTFQFPATATVRSILCDFGKPQRLMSLTLVNSMPAVMLNQCHQKMPQKISPWSFTRTMLVRTAKNCVCDSSIS